MPSFKTLLFVYVFGGLTFVPLLVIGLLALVWYTSPEVVVTDNSKTGGNGKAELDEATAEVKKRHKTSSRIYRSGWVTVRRTFEPVADASSDAGYMNMMASSYRSFVDGRSKDPRKSRPRDKYYAVVKDTVLFLYEDEQENDCYAAIKLPLHEVVIYPEELIEGELFMKKNAICLKPIKKAGEDAEQEVPSLILRPPPVAVNGTSSNGTPIATDSSASLAQQPWFIFPSINHDKEDWYHTLVSASKLPEPAQIAKDATLFDPNDMGNLVDAIDDQPDPIPTRWLNAMIGRLFFSVYRTSAVEEYIVRKLMRKLSKVNKPDFLGDIEVKEVDVGNTTPFFSKPMLKELTAEGDASIEVHVKYEGEFRIAISTVATLNLGQRFKSYSVKLVLAVILKDLEGNVLFKVKRPPSNRVWFGFTSPPKLGLRIEPVVSTRQIKWSLVTKPIESRLRELVAESIVLPHMDDIAFFDTRPYGQRGGIYGECARKASDLRGDGAEGMEPALETEEGGQIMPGVPNLKLGDPKEASADSLRHRQARPRKSSGTESILSTKSAPLGVVPASTDKPSSFALSSWGTSTSLDAQPHHESRHHKHKDHDHSRKKSWFTSAPALHKAKLVATESDPVLPLQAGSSVDAAAIVPGLVKDAEKPMRKSASSTAVSSSGTPSGTENSDVALERLRGILEAGKSRSGPPDIAPMASVQQAAQLSSPRLATEAVLTASPEPSLYKTSSGSSIDTTHAPDADLSSTTPAQPVKLGGLASERTNLMRHASNHSTSSSRSATSNKSEHIAQLDTASIASEQGASSAASIHSSNSTSSNIAILQNWKTKATDKQAIQASVNQAKDAMSKWGSKWHAYRKAQQAANQGDEDGIPGTNASDLQVRLHQVVEEAKSNTSSTQAVPPAGPKGTSKQDGKLTPETRSRSSSMISSSPTGLFQPSAAITTTSLSGLPTDSSLSGRPATTRSPVVRRVPPPSQIPVHPAVGNENVEKPPPPKRQSYTPAAMMAIPGIDASRRFHASSADIPRTPSQPPPPLPARDAAETQAALRPEPPVRIPAPEMGLDRDLSTSAVNSRSSDVSVAPTLPPPLPARPQPTGSASLNQAESFPIQSASSADESGNLAGREQSHSALIQSNLPLENDSITQYVDETTELPALSAQPPTPAPEPREASEEKPGKVLAPAPNVTSLVQ